MCPKLHLHQYKGKYYRKARVDLSSSGSGAFVRCGNPGLTLQSIPSCYFLQGSYKCGACKPGFVGDQITGCKSQSVRRCPNGEISPCHEKAECVVERDGSISCVVRAKPPASRRPGAGSVPRRRARSPGSATALSWRSRLLAPDSRAAAGSLWVLSGELCRSWHLRPALVWLFGLGFFCLKRYKCVITERRTQLSGGTRCSAACWSQTTLLLHLSL